jgi:transposase
MRNEITKDSFKGQSFCVGIDSHKKNWTVTILGEQYEHKTYSQNPDPGLLAGYLKRNFPGPVIVCYSMLTPGIFFNYLR